MIEKIMVYKYKTKDGKLFEDEGEAEKHELELANSKAYEILAKPDLDNPNASAVFQGYLLVIAPYNHDLLAEHWCYRHYGSRIEYTQGHLSCENLVISWLIREVDLSYANEDKDLILGSIKVTK